MRDAGEFGIKVGEPTVDFARRQERRDEGHQDADRRRRRPVQEEQASTSSRATASLTADGNVTVGGTSTARDRGDEGDHPRDRLGASGRSRARQFGGRVIGTEEAWALDGAAGDAWPSSAPARRAPRSPRPTRAWASRCCCSRGWTACCPTEDADISKLAERGFKKQGIDVHTKTFVENVADRRRRACTFTYGDEQRRGRLARHRRRPRPRRRGARARRRRRQARRARPDRGRRRACARRPEGVRDRRPRARPGARAQGAPTRASSPSRTPPAWRPHPLDYDDIPRATFCTPNVACFGLTEEQATRRRATTSSSARSRTAPSARGTVYGDRTGLVKIVGDKRYGELLGAPHRRREGRPS